MKPTDSDQIVVVNFDGIRPFETSEMTEKEKQIVGMKEAAVFAASKVPVPQQRVYEFLHDLAKKVRDKGMFIAVAVTIYRLFRCKPHIFFSCANRTVRDFGHILL